MLIFSENEFFGTKVLFSIPFNSKMCFAPLKTTFSGYERDFKETM